jgi:dephospho-CoA kinase
MNNNKLIVILNGNATSGKNTFVEFVNDVIPTVHYSYVDYTRNMLHDAGIDVDNKSDKIRKLLCDVNNALEEYGDIPYNDCKDVTLDFLSDAYESNILFIDCREPEKIERMKKNFGAITVFINSDVECITTNSADAKVAILYKYDFIVDNTDTLNNLREEVRRFTNEYCLKL